MADEMKAEDRPQTAHGRYELLKTYREPFLQRAREQARLTIPALLPPEGHSGASPLYKPYQSEGARGVNNLASKLLIGLFPPGHPFHRMGVNDFAMGELAARNGGEGDTKAEVEEALGKHERAVAEEIEASASKATLVEVLKHLVVAGNALLFVDDKLSFKFYPLTKYVCKRDLAGNVLDIVAREELSKSALPEAARALVETEPTEQKEKQSEDKSIPLYTWIRRQPDSSWKVHQEVCDKIVPDSEGTYPANTSAWMPLRWSKVDGEDYGRAHVEDYIGDLRSLESATQSIIDFAAAAAKILAFVNENGLTSKEEVARAPSGSVLDGDAKDVTILMLEKSQDFAVCERVADKLEARLREAFLVVRQRNAERVTAEEVRAIIHELEQGLGGTYSILAEELQRPLLARVIHRMTLQKKLPKLPDDIVKPRIITGLAGIERNSDLQRMDLLIAGVKEVFGPEATNTWVNPGAYIKRRATALGLDPKGLVREQSEVDAANQQQSMQSMTEKLGGPTIKAMSDQMLAARQPQAPTGEAE